ncbi:extracellular solute-binding protein [Nocardioides sp. zg-579]|uniref:Extracellular solute-binding protein n=1 Tax=Nocardioides marmotae TaxID=2663857 RepID=A0A6I3J1B2_9ACTN|nr:extracellular solute-binding protein [Nocardioides marmotae]MCR6030430.1 extracellular solute-binding protein [Gordonia jinghuaiqii]MTB94066.1 extracellular solute-binding protein [Nocardioides marmotae]QKE00368.1 extracellular solute-binding protein [Nocardioides marmotae]
MLRRRGRRSTRAGLAALVVLALGLGLTGCTDDADPPAPDPTRAAPPDRLLFGVWGNDEEVAAYQAMVDTYNARSQESQVELRSWEDREELVDALQAGGKVPDVFLASRRDLKWLVDEGITQPVDELLDERGTEFGDNYSRDALQAFSYDARLQCMPYGISPAVVFYNTELVDFERMRNRGLPAPADENDTRWNFEEFVAAADFATRPRKRTRGVHVDPTLSGLAPFIESGGGAVFDSETDPTSLAFASDGSREALARTLELLRNPQLTLSEKQLQRATPQTWFERGRLGMMIGDRSLVPVLRQVQGLDFDVMPIPTLGSYATVGELSGLCLSQDAASTAEGADFLVHATSTESVTRVVRAGYLVPANLEVAYSEDFVQPGRLPLHSEVFTDSIRALRVPPLLDSWPELDAAVRDDIRSLVTSAPDLDLDAVTEQIDLNSQRVLDPDFEEPTESPSESASESASPSDEESTED